MTPNEILLKQCRPDNVMPIYFLWRAIWRWVFDEISCPFNHRSEIEKEIIKWNQIVQYQKKIRSEQYGQTESDVLAVGTKGNLIDELEYQIGMMCKTLVENEEGLWNNSKDTLRIHKIDYKQSIHCNQYFPEFKNKDGKKKAEEALKQNMLDHPEYYIKEN